ncbi:MAG: YceD family protein [Sphingomonas sp.]
MTPPEFSRPQPLDRIGDSARPVTIDANEAERRALADRFGLRAVEALSATCGLHRDAQGVTVTGMVQAQVVQTCVVTGDAIPVSIEAPLALRFVADDSTATAPEEIELSEDALDVIPFTGSAIDLGDAAAETMALALDSFPRGPRADDALRKAGVLKEGEAGPFGALAGLRDALAGKPSADTP